MRKFFLVSLLSLLSLVAGAQGYYTKYYADKSLIAEARQWMASGEWKNGFEGALPHESVNAVEFYTQYRKNPEQWIALFKWLSDTDLLSIPKGKHPIVGTTMVASVEDSQNQPLAKRQSESHIHNIDFQFVVRGVERFGIIDHYTSKPNCRYRPDVIHYDYDEDKTLFYDSTPDRFFIFFPGDWHIAKVANDSQDQDIRVVVIKVSYVE